MNLTIVQVNPDARVTLFIGDISVSSVAHVSPRVYRNNWLFGNHVNRPVLHHQFALSAKKAVHSPVVIVVTLTGVSCQIRTSAGRPDFANLRALRATLV